MESSRNVLPTVMRAAEKSSQDREEQRRIDLYIIITKYTPVVDMYKPIVRSIKEDPKLGTASIIACIRNIEKNRNALSKCLMTMRDHVNNGPNSESASSKDQHELKTIVENLVNSIDATNRELAKVAENDANAKSAAVEKLEELKELSAHIKALRGDSKDANAIEGQSSDANGTVPLTDEEVAKS